MNTSNLTRVHRDLFDENSRLKFVKSYDDISLVLESPSSTGPSIGFVDHVMCDEMILTVVVVVFKMVVFSQGEQIGERS